jgi:hypothetical protein
MQTCIVLPHTPTMTALLLLAELEESLHGAACKWAEETELEQATLGSPTPLRNLLCILSDQACIVVISVTNGRRLQVITFGTVIRNAWAIGTLTPIGHDRAESTRHLQSVAIRMAVGANLSIVMASKVVT